MNKLIIKYIGVFFLFLILVLGFMGFIIYDKLMIEYEKYIKEAIMWNIGNTGGIQVGNNEIKGIDENLSLAVMSLSPFAQVGKSIGEEIKNKFPNTNLIHEGLSTGRAFNKLASGGKAEDILQMNIDWTDSQAIEKEGTRQLEKVTDLQLAVFNSQDFSDKVYALADTDKYKNRIGEGDIEDIGPDLGYALHRNMSDSEFSVYMRKEYGRATEEDIRIVTELYRDVYNLNVEAMNSKLNDISLKNYDAIMKAYEDYKEYYGKDNATFKSLKNPKDIFGRIKGSNGKERQYVSALLATLPTEDLIGMLKDQDAKGFNAIMDLLDSRPDNRSSFTSAISNANKVLGNMGSNAGPDIIKAVMLYNSMGLDNLISINPNIANLSVNDRVYKNIIDKNGNVIGREDTGLLRNNYNPMMFIELAKLIKGLEDKRKSYNKTQPIENRIDW